MAELKHLPAHVVDRMLAGLLAPSDLARADEHAASCPSCEEKIAAATVGRATFLAKSPVETATRQLVSAQQKRNLVRRTVITASCTLAIAVGVWSVNRPGSPQKPSEASRVAAYIGDKGGSAEAIRFEIFRPHNGTRQLAEPRELTSAGEEVRIYVVPSPYHHVTILSLSGEGVASVVGSEKRDAPGWISQRLIFDDSPQPERLFVVLSPEALNSNALALSVEEAAKKHGLNVESFLLPGGDAGLIRSVLFEKIPRPSPQTP